MPRWLLIALIVLPAGCRGGGEGGRTVTVDERRFAPAEVRLHPVFTRVADFDGDGRVDGIEAMLEMTDRFDDPTKGSGTVVFELYEFDEEGDEGRGRRLGREWTGSLVTLDLQRRRWNPQLRGYEFQLDQPGLGRGGRITLEARFAPIDGPRLEDTITLENRPPAGLTRPTSPPNSPTTRASEP